jgi:hypothetical protein
MILTHIILVIGAVYWLLLTAYKHNLPLYYENFYDNLREANPLRRILPEDFCLLCFVTQCSLMVSVITALLLSQPILSTIIVAISSTAYVIYLNNVFGTDGK